MKNALKPIPSMKEKNIVPPDLKHDYFLGAEEFPFLPLAEQYEPVNAWWLSEASLLAYAPPRFAQYTMGYRCGLHQFRFFEGKTTEVFAASNNKMAIVSFRGTEVVSFRAIFDVLTDIKVKLVPYGPEGQRVHQGFKEALEETWLSKGGLKEYLDELKSLNPDIKIWFTGHSLGGAMATLAAALYGDVQGLYTFGSPKVGNIPFVNHYSIRTWRLIHNYDLIVYMPPSNPLMKKDETTYAHVGETYLITDVGEVVHLDGSPDLAEGSMELPVPTSLGGFFKDRIQKVINSIDNMDIGILKNSALDTVDHAPIFYVLKLWNSFIRNR